MKWTDAEDIAIALAEKYPGIDPLTIRFTDLRARVLALDEFDDDPKVSNEPKAPSIAAATSPDGVPPPFGAMIVQKREWFACPPPWFLTAVCLSDGTFERLRRMSSTSCDSRSVPLTASLRRST